MGLDNFSRGNALRISIVIAALMVFVILVTGCVSKPSNIAKNETPTALPAVPTVTSTPQLPNPASKYCVEQGYNISIRTDPNGSQAGYCIFPDGKECEEWAYYRGECTL